MPLEIIALLKSYHLSKQVLRKDLQKIDGAALDWRIKPGAITIASSILHIVGYEYLARSVMTGSDVLAAIETQEWEMYSEGFARDLFHTPIKNSSSSNHNLLLENCEKATHEAIGCLSAADLERVVRFFPMSELNQERLVDICLRDLVLQLLKHEQYHRGQITLLQYLYKNQK